MKPGDAALEDCMRLRAAAGLEADPADLLPTMVLVIVIVGILIQRGM